MTDRAWLHWLPRAFFVVVFCFTLITGVLGVNYGTYGDEARLVNSVSESVRTLLFLPRWYNYPSLSYTVTLTQATPQLLTIAEHAAKTGTFSAELQDTLAQSILRDQSFLLRTRIAFFVLTWIGIIWIYLFVKRITHHEWIASLTGALFASSWELQYHARLIAPDGLTFSFGALSLYLLSRFLEVKTFRWLVSASIAAAFACGAKYQAGIFLFPVLFVGISTYAKQGYNHLIKQLGILIGVFAFTFILITPGAFTDTFKFLSSILFEAKHYQTGHANFTVTPGLPHATLLSTYFSTVAFSPFPAFAILVTGGILLGIYITLKFRPNIERVVFCLVPLAFFLFMVSQRALNVRNNLLLFCFLAYFLGLGLLYARQHLPKKGWVIAISTLIGILAYNIWYQSYALQQILHPERAYEQAVSAIIQAKEPISLSSGARALLAQDLRLKPLLDSSHQQVKAFLFLEDEVDDRFPANQARTYRVLGGPLESNMDYYPTFSPQRRKVIRMDAELARTHGILPGTSSTHSP